MRRRVWFLLLLLPVLAWASEPLRLRVGTPEGLPGYELPARGGLQVEDPEKRRILRCVEQAMKVEFVWQAYPTRRLLALLAEGQLDLAFPMGFNEERAARLLQSEAAWDNPDVWLSLRPIDPQDRRLRVAARLGSPQHDDQSGLGYARLVGTYTYDELARTLSRDLADAVVVPASVYRELRPLWPDGLRVAAGRARSSGFYLTKGDPKGLAASLNEAVRRCRTSPR